MTKDELSTKLTEMRNAAPHGRMGVYTLLFGILFDEEIEDSGTNAAQIATESGFKGLDIEINYGRRLARHVRVNRDVAQRWKPV